MNRRSVIRNIVIVSAGAALLPSCLNSENQSASVTLKNIKISQAQQNLLAGLAEIIIPTTDTPGAKELASHEFLLTMVDDCFAPDDQQKFVTGLIQFEGFTQKKYLCSFVKCSVEQRNELLKSIEDKKSIPMEVSSFYITARELTLQSYLSSEYYMAKVAGYNIIPGKYHGCVSVATA